MLGPTRSLQAWFAAAGLLWIAGCGSLLGLEDRSLDESGLGNGYAGCTPGGDCDGCINQSHRDACLDDASGGAGGSSSGNGGNSGGGTGGNSNVTTDAGGTSGAANAGGASGSGGVSSTSGGSGGMPVCDGTEPANDVCDTCVCETCVTELEDCAVDVGCIEIWTCFEQHACNPTPGVENSCFDADRCQSVIMNNGGPEGASLGLVGAMLTCAVEDCGCGNENCTFENGCECATCQDACECAGYPAEYCASTCSGGPVKCASAGPGACLGCSTCISECICAGASELDCLVDCSLSACGADDCNTCDNPSDHCVCDNTSTSSSCSETQLGMSCYDYYALQGVPERLDCSICGCENCPALNTRCEFDPFSINGIPGCVALVMCMDATGCAGETCNLPATCGDLLAELDGPQGYSMQIAEGLLACKNSFACPACSEPVTTEITCGGQTCYPYEPSDATGVNAPACCTGNGDSCGYHIDAFFPAPADVCFPANAPGEAYEDCPAAEIATDTYSAYLPGCCMANNSTCGLLESQIGLGCVPPDVVGQPVPNPAIACAP